MRGIILFICSAVFLVTQVNAQNNIKFKINHKLRNDAFQLNQASYNNIDHNFNVTRLEYYISEVSLIHDGGMETVFEDVWILANASAKTEVNFGDHNITTVEKIKFHIGVNPEHNHLDPTTYSPMHALAPKSPSMHWGWTAGYRFVAIEGNGGSNLNQLFQLHGLGDANYFTTEVELDITAENNVIEINLDADYARALEDIEVNAGVIVHGDNLQAQQCLENFRDFVFSPEGTVIADVDFTEVKNFSVYPNPIQNGQTTISLDVSDFGNNYDLSITSVDGKQMQYLNAINDGQSIDLINYNSGIYFVNLIKDNQVIITNKIIIK